MLAKCEHFDDKATYWDIPEENSKNGAPIRHKLPRQAQAIAKELISLAGNSDWVLPSTRGLNHFGNWPAGLPQFNTALEAADSMLDKIGCGLFDSTLEDAAQKIEAEWEEEERRKAEEVENG